MPGDCESSRGRVPSRTAGKTLRRSHLVSGDCFRSGVCIPAHPVRQPANAEVIVCAHAPHFATLCLADLSKSEALYRTKPNCTSSDRIKFLKAQQKRSYGQERLSIRLALFRT